MLIRLNAEEITTLETCAGTEFGADTFASFMAELAARMSEDGTLDIDREDRERLKNFLDRDTHNANQVQSIFGRSLKKAWDEFLGTD